MSVASTLSSREDSNIYWPVVEVLIGQSSELCFFINLAHVNQCIHVHMLFKAFEIRKQHDQKRFDGYFGKSY